MKLFGSSGIRGVVNKEITPALAIKIGRAVGSAHKKVVVGWDPRTSNELFANAVTSGLLSMGADVFSVGMVSTPTLAHAGRKFDCGLMITASHNPSEYNGFKLWNPDGLAFNTEQMMEIEDIILNKETNHSNWNAIGRRRKYTSAIQEHKDFILKHVKNTDLKVVVDCGSGAASTITPYLLREMGCEVITINSQPDGYFPGRDPEPIEKNLDVLKRTVVSCNANLGIAHDGDADRVMAVDENGKFVSGDLLLAIFASEVAEKSIVVPVDTSMIIDDVLPNIKIIRTKVGDVFIGECMKKHNSEFGGEPSGTWIFPKITYCPDAIYAAAKVVEIAAEKPLSERVSELPTYPITRRSIPYTGIKKEELMERLGKELGAIKCSDVNTTDGTRLGFEDGWTLVRVSGTEPKVRITVEARKEKRMKELYEHMNSLVTRCIK
ncbi:MAG: phosphoglucosamine mutase [Thermoplasmata archaeon]